MPNQTTVAMTELNALSRIRAALVNAIYSINEELEALEDKLKTEPQLARSRAYGTGCRLIGILESRVKKVEKEITKIIV